MRIAPLRLRLVLRCVNIVSYGTQAILATSQLRCLDLSSWVRDAELHELKNEHFGTT